MIEMRSLVLAAVLAACLVLSATPAAKAGNPFGSLAGTWRGEGQIHLKGGQTEKLTCKAYYTMKAEGAELGLALSCASASNKIDLRAGLNDANGTVSGSWEERAFNSSGTIAGKASDSELKLTITGTLTAEMAITVGGGTQKVTIATDGTGFTGVDLELIKA